MKIVLIGYMGSGKSSVGKKLAEVLNVPFKDIDLEIENEQGSSIPDIFLNKGEVYFRKVENSILKKILSQDGNFVLATGGGTPCYADSMSFMTEQENVVTIFLKTPLTILSDRLFLEKENRPLLSHIKTPKALNDFIRKHLFERAFYYNQATEIVDNSEENIDEMVKKIVMKLF
ncbi:MAG: shikimate kinase [Aequorivita sp.]|nr:shikimate kinase [Aequorivita sp.]